MKRGTSRLRLKLTRRAARAADRRKPIRVKVVATVRQGGSSETRVSAIRNLK